MFMQPVAASVKGTGTVRIEVGDDLDLPCEGQGTPACSLFTGGIGKLGRICRKLNRMVE